MVITETFASRIYGGVDIGGTKTAVVVSFEPPKIASRIVFPTIADEDPEPALKRIIDGMQQALSEQQLEPSSLHSIGVSCGSPLDPLQGIIQSPPNLPMWKNVPIKSTLEDEFQVPCFLENDANAGAMAEHLFGAGRGSEDMVFLTMGTGLGAGLILNGRLYRGASYLSGEIGHVRLRRSGPRAYGKTGSAEAWASGAGMAKIAQAAVRRAIRDGEATELAGQDGGLESITAREIWEASQRGDAVAGRIVAVTAKRLGEVLAILIDLFNPERIVIGGLAVRMGEVLLGPAREEAIREALPGAVGACEIVPAELGEEIGDVAALCVGMSMGTDSTEKVLQTPVSS